MTAESDRIDALEEEILGMELTSQLERKAFQLFEAMPFTTTVLFALEMWLNSEEINDELGAKMVGELVRKYARHEAETA